ncbi:dienelactone hydrolase family protein [Aquimarina celericrescens]|uniref:Dienelactone hydrolase family protein n=1 Tax=Aquimarina celericrescens TaxID=1964542 RepID=A0ABW5AZA5_9FLAO|nr:alpha/beta hydrolase [Aquimarina celericrescens]
MILQDKHKPISIKIGDVVLQGNLTIPENPLGIIIFSHGSGSSRLSPRNNYVAKVLQEKGLATLLFDLLTEQEDTIYENRFDIDLLTKRLIAVTNWVKNYTDTKGLKMMYFGASTGAASALRAAASLGSDISAVISRGGRPDLAMKELNKVTAPTLLIVGGRDDIVIQLNQKAYQKLQCDRELKIISGASHLFEEPGKLEEVANISAHWFIKKISVEDD